MFHFKIRQLLPFSGAIAFAGFTGYIFYRFFLKEDDEDDACIDPTLPPSISVRKKELKIPKSAVGVVIGRQGTNVKHIQLITKTTINFKDEGEERICIIKGRTENIENAEKLILKTIEEIPKIESEEMHIPGRAVGKIIGHGGSTVSHLSRMTGAKIRVNHRDEESLDIIDREDSLRTVVIRGTKDQIKAAITAIQIKVDEEEELRQRIQASAESMSHRGRSKETHLNNNISNDVNPTFEHLSSDSDMYIEAFVSAVDSPTHFWLQVKGHRTVELDKLVDKMTTYYNDPECKALHDLNEINPGDIVSAVFPHDNMWYRGRICTREENDDPSKIVVYFLDFGDTENVEADNVCELRTDFLRLNFQAIECYLANVDPRSAEGDESAEAFELLSHATKWKPVMVKVIEYKEENTHTIPWVRLVDTSGPEDVDIAEELVKRGLAQWKENEMSHPRISLDN